MGITRTRKHLVAITCAAITLVSALVCSPAQASESTNWTRLGGETALDTMALVSEAGHESASTVIIATSDGYWDALSAASLAGAEDAPILLTDGKTLSSQTMTEIKRLGADRAIIVGGTSAVSADVQSSIERLVFNVDRVSGGTAVETATAVARELRGESSNFCFVATSDGYWDALSASAYAYAKKAPIFLTGADGELPIEDLVEMRNNGYSEVIVCGGTAVVSSSVESQVRSIGITSIQRLGGADAYDTSSLICDWEVSQGMTREGMVVATGDGYWDALTGSVLAGANDSIIALVSDSHKEATNAQFVNNNNEVSTGYVLGGEAAVSRPLLDYLNGHWVVTSEAWDEPVYEYQDVMVGYRYVASNGRRFLSADECKGYIEWQLSIGHYVTYTIDFNDPVYDNEKVQVGTIHHDAMSDPVWVSG